MHETKRIGDALINCQKDYINKVRLLSDNVDYFCLHHERAQDLFNVTIEVLGISLFLLYPLTSMANGSPMTEIMKAVKLLLNENKRFFDDPKNLQIKVKHNDSI
jgi:hypothetical protein